MVVIDCTSFLQPTLEIVPLATITPDTNQCSSCLGLYINAPPPAPPADHIALNPRRLQECRHVFCSQCIENWFADKDVCGCPLCRHQYPVIRAPPPPPGPARLPPLPPPSPPLILFIENYGSSIVSLIRFACFCKLLATGISKLGLFSIGQALEAAIVFALYTFLWFRFRFRLFVVVVLFWLIAPYFSSGETWMLYMRNRIGLIPFVIYVPTALRVLGMIVELVAFLFQFFP